MSSAGGETSSIAIVSGSPGAGKTTISRELAKRSPRGVHLVSDEFYYFIAHLIAPSTPQAADQNATVITAVARAAGAFALGGYDVYVDGIFGRWYLPLVTQELRHTGLSIQYIVLTATLDDALARVAGRQMPGIEDVVRKMHGQLSDLDGFERHAVDTHDRDVEDVLREIERRRATGDFLLDQ